jgi:hypothetical protein
MKRTIASSFLFLLPINMCYMYGKLFHLNLSVICFGLSVANHSHTFFTHDIKRKKVINLLDQYINGFNLFYTWYTAINSFNCIVYATTNIFIISYIYFLYLLPTKTENYTEKQKTLHALWHFISIFSMTHCNWVCICY